MVNLVTSEFLLTAVGQHYTKWVGSTSAVLSQSIIIFIAKNEVSEQIPSSEFPFVASGAFQLHAALRGNTTQTKEPKPALFKKSSILTFSF
jgi:hypothetical protein